MRGLWRGLTPTLLMTIPSQVTYMTCYDFFRGELLDWDRRRMTPGVDAIPSPAWRSDSTAQPNGKDKDLVATVTTHSLLASLVAGALSRAISATLVTPLELVRTRLQAATAASSSLSGGSSLLTSNLRVLRAEVRDLGPRVLWRGLGSTLWRDVPFSALYFAGYEAFKRLLAGGGLGEGSAKGPKEEFTVAFVSGAASGTIAAVATHPFDLVKTRLQAVARTPASASGQRAAVSPAAGRTATILRQIYRAEGLQGLFRGLSPRVAKVAPACGIMIASFEVVSRLLS